MSTANSIIPVLWVQDIDISRAFYQQALQFQLDWLWRAAAGEPAFAQMSRDHIKMYLSEREQGPAGTTVYLYVDNVDEWHRQLLAKQVPVETMPHDEPWGNREMLIKDPDGNQLKICTPLK